MNKLAIAFAASFLMSFSAHTTETMPMHDDDSWAKAIGDTRTLESDQVACLTQRDLDEFHAIQRMPGVQKEFAGCTILPRGTQVGTARRECASQAWLFALEREKPGWPPHTYAGRRLCMVGPH